MSWLKKGPELKLPKLRRPSMGGAGGGRSQIKPPAAVADLYSDLRDRRLLLPLALVLVAIAAVPFLLGGSDPELPPPPPAEGVGASPGSAAAKLAVVEATPGLRDYKKRLGNRTPSDPFKPHYTGLPPGVKLETTSSSTASGGGSESVTVEDSSGTVDVEVDPGGSGGGEGSGGSGGNGGGSGGSGGGPKSGGLRLIEFRFNIQLSRTVQAEDGTRKWSKPEVRKRVKSLTQLPGKKNAVATVAGVDLRNGKTYFIVSDEVKSLDGDFTCKTRTPKGLCELLEIETGFPLELVAGSNDVRHRIKVTKVDAVWAGRPDKRAASPRAAFGGPAAKSLPRP